MKTAQENSWKFKITQTPVFKFSVEPSGPWILQEGYWNDEGIWIDSAIWKDS